MSDPPRDYSLLPFWFWNDALDAGEIVRQIADFEAHGVYGFVLHPRVGLPRDCGWMSEGLLGFMRVAIEEAARRDMTVLLYDEGMYPSGSASGQVVAADAAHKCRCLALADPDLPTEHGVVLETAVNGRRLRVVDRPADSVIRGLHYLGDGPAEDEPPAADLLNPAAVASFIRLVYDRYFAAFGEHFGGTIKGIFTDEPNALGRVREKDIWPGTTGILNYVNRLLGEDFTPHLPALWLDLPDAERHRERYRRAIGRRLEETWYAPLFDWCSRHGVALCGHPDRGDDIASQRFFHVPGQDLVWRWVEPDQPTAIEGPESTQAKASSSAAVHLGRHRNGNEFCGAYGPQTTFDEFQWLAKWCLVRGVNLLIPHAFYYSVRGPRRDERPPQVGPFSPWWDRFKPFADACRRLCWLNATGRHVCDVAILTGDRCPWRAAKALLEDQRGFNYLEDRLLLDDTAAASADAIAVGPMRYRVLVVEDESLLTPQLRAVLAPFLAAGRVVFTAEEAERFSEVGRVVANAHAGLRVRRVARDEGQYVLLFNEAGEGRDDLRLLPAAAFVVDPATGRETKLANASLTLGRHEMKLLRLPFSDEPTIASGTP